MSQSRSGMIGIPKVDTMGDMEAKLLLARDDQAPAGPQLASPMPAIAEGTGESVRSVRKRPAVPSKESPLDSLLDDMPVQDPGIVLSTRIPEWIARPLNEFVREQQKQRMGVTKQAIIAYSLAKILGLTPPEGYRFY